MTLPASGIITMSNVRTELCLSGTVTLVDLRIRNLFGVFSGNIRLTNGYGKTAGWHFENFSVGTPYASFFSTINGYNYNNILSTVDGATGKPAIYSYGTTGYFYFNVSSGVPSSVVVKVRANYVVNYNGSISGLDPAPAVLQYSIDSGGTWQSLATLTTSIVNYSLSVASANLNAIRIRAINYKRVGGVPPNDYNNTTDTYFYDMLVSNG